MKVYLISGLAADKRMFRNIRLPENREPVYLEWIKPHNDEDLHEYAGRMAEKIDTTKPFAVIGLSMGGMVASEIAMKYKPAATILISSAPCSSQLPPYFSIVGKLWLHKLVPMRLLKYMGILKHLFGAETNEDRKILREVVKESEPSFVRWSMNAVLTWKMAVPPASYFHIHGSRDEVLPVRYTRPTHIIKGAGHMMILDRAEEINSILKTLLSF